MQTNTETQVRSPRAQAALEVIAAPYEPTNEDLAEAFAVHAEMQANLFSSELVLGVVAF